MPSHFGMPAFKEKDPHAPGRQCSGQIANGMVPWLLSSETAGHSPSPQQVPELYSTAGGALSTASKVGEENRQHQEKSSR